MENKDVASRIFTNNYKPNEQHFNLENIRKKNLKKLSDLIAEKDKKLKEIDKDKRQIVINIESNTDLSKDEKTNEINKQFIEFDKLYAEIEIELDAEIKKTLKHQAKLLLVLKNDKEKFEFYKLLTKTFDYNIDKKYLDLEKNIYREFLMEHKDIENIIISYSELEANNKKVPVNKEKKEYKEISEESKKAIELVKIALKSGLWRDFYKACKAVNALNDKALMKLLKDKLVKFGELQIKKFEELLNKTYNGFKEDDVIPTSQRMFELRNLYQFVPDCNHDKYLEKMNYLITIYNVSFQNQVKNEYEDDNRHYYTRKQIALETVGNVVNLIEGSKVANKINKNKIKKNLQKIDNSSNKEEISILKANIESIKKRIADSVIAQGPLLFCSRNELQRIKPKLYRGEKLSKYDTFMLNKSINVISKKILKKTGKTIANDNIKDNHSAIINVFDSYIEFLSIYNYNDKNAFKNNVNHVLHNLDNYSNYLSKNEYYAYNEVFNNIAKYRLTNSGKIYETNDVLSRLHKISGIYTDIYEGHIEEFEDVRKSNYYNDPYILRRR